MRLRSQAAVLLALFSVSRSEAALNATFSPYPGYTGGVVVGGYVLVYQYINATSLTVFYDLSGLPFNVTGGAHIHAGNSCSSDSAVGGHWYSVPTDPWTTYTYMAADSIGLSIGSFQINTGYGLESQNTGHAFVIHDNTSARIACGLLTLPPPPPPAAGRRAGT